MIWLLCSENTVCQYHQTKEQQYLPVKFCLSHDLIEKDTAQGCISSPHMINS